MRDSQTPAALGAAPALIAPRKDSRAARPRDMRPDISGRPPPLKRIRRPGQEAAHLENTNSSNTENTTGKAAAQGWRDRSRVVDLRDEMFRRNIEHLHKLGPRVYYAMLIDLGAQRLIRTEIESLVQRYARIDPARLAAAGGDQWPPP